jgi:hypothetical protein
MVIGDSCDRHLKIDGRPRFKFNVELTYSWYDRFLPPPLLLLLLLLLLMVSLYSLTVDSEVGFTNGFEELQITYGAPSSVYETTVSPLLYIQELSSLLLDDDDDGNEVDVTVEEVCRRNKLWKTFPPSNPDSAAVSLFFKKKSSSFGGMMNPSLCCCNSFCVQLRPRNR